MTKKKHWLLPAVGIAALLVVLVAIPALAATGGAPLTPGTAPGITNGTAPCYGGGPAGRGMGIGPMSDDIAGILGLDAATLQADRQAGQSLADIAAKQNISREDLITSMLKVHQDAVDARVQDGTLTQAQADQILSLMKTRIEQQIDFKGVGPAAGRGGFGFGRGGMGGRMGQGFGPGARWGQTPTQPTNVTNS